VSSKWKSDADNRLVHIAQDRFPLVVRSWRPQPSGLREFAQIKSLSVNEHVVPLLLGLPSPHDFTGSKFDRVAETSALAIKH
jgi:hypothetical protein